MPMVRFLIQVPVPSRLRRKSLPATEGRIYPRRSFALSGSGAITGGWKNLRPFQREAELYALDLEELYQEYGFSRNAREDVAVMLQYQGTRVAYPEVKRVLDSLLSRYQLCVASTTDTAPLEQDLKRAGLVFHRVFTSQSLKVYKPDHEFYTIILHALSLRPAEAVFVGDSLTDDVQGPQDVGMRACWLNRKGIVPEGVKPDFQIHSLEQLPSVLESIEREL